MQRAPHTVSIYINALLTLAYMGLGLAIIRDCEARRHWPGEIAGDISRLKSK